MNFTFLKVPDELKKLRRWTCWKYEMRKKADGADYKTKIPVEMNGLAYAWSNQSLWLAFEAACKGKTGCIGFFFGAGIVGVDLDKCRDDATGVVESWATEMIASLNSYTELSPSRTGFHIFVRGVLPESKDGKVKNRKGRIEMYSDGRFFTVTGWHVEGTPNTVNQCATLAEIQKKMQDGIAVESVKEQTANPVVDESAEDWKIIAGTAEDLKSRDAAKIVKEISERYPERFTSRQAEKKNRGNLSYWAYTIHRFLEHAPAPKTLTTGATASKLVVRCLELVSADKYAMERTEWLWQYRVPIGEVCVFAGIPGTGKSTVATDLVSRLSNGQDFPDCENPMQLGCDSVILVGEDSITRTFKPRLVAAEAQLERVHFAVMSLKFVKEDKPSKKETRIALESDLEQIEKTIKEHPAIRLIVIDPLDSYLGKLRKNKDEDMRPLVDRLNEFAASLNISVLYVVHFNKSSEKAAIDRVSGAMSIVAGPRASWVFLKDPEDESKQLRLMSKLKVNGTSDEKACTLKYKIVNSEVPAPDGGEPIETSKIEWHGRDAENRDSDDIMAAAKNVEPKDGKVPGCADLLKRLLENGPKSARLLHVETEKAGFSPATFGRACKKLNTKSTKTSDGWYVSLPEGHLPIKGFNYASPNEPELLPIEEDQFFRAMIEPNSEN